MHSHLTERQKLHSIAARLSVISLFSRLNLGGKWHKYNTLQREIVPALAIECSELPALFYFGQGQLFNIGAYAMSNNTINENLQDWINKRPNVQEMSEAERMEYAKEWQANMDAIEAEVENNKYYKKVAQIHKDLGYLKDLVYFWAGPNARATHMDKEYEALYNNAKEAVIMAIHNIKAAQLALSQALRIQAEFEFVPPKRKVIEVDTSGMTIQEV